MGSMYRGIDLHQEVFITTRDGVRIPLKIEELEFTPCSWTKINGYLVGKPSKIPVRKPAEIKNVIFNDPATIVIWSDGSKTVVKCQEGDTYSKELGLAMCISKKFFDNKGNYNEVFKKWIQEDQDPTNIIIEEALVSSARNALKNLGETLAKTFS